MVPPSRLKSRHFLPALLLLAFAGLFSASCAKGAEPHTVFALPRSTVEAGHLVVVCDDNYPPYSMAGSSGQDEGIVPDQWKAWSQVTGIEVELRPMPWAQAIETFEAGKADVLDTVFETSARDKKYDFTPPYATLSVPVFIHRSISGIASLGDLRGFRVAAKEGDAAVDQLRAGGVTDLVVYPSYEAIIREAAAQNVKVFTIDKPPAFYFLYKYGIDKDFRIAFELGSGQFHRAVRKGDIAVLDLLKAGFKAVPQAQLAAIDDRWLGRGLGDLIDMRLFEMIGALILIVLVLLLAIAWTLRLRVASATAELRDKVAQLERSEAATRVALSDKEVLLKEVHHRVKNNMQVMSSLIELASFDLRDESDRNLLRETQERIQAMAQLHELLYHSHDLSSIDAGEYIEAVVSELAMGHGFHGVERSVGHGRLDIDHAVPLGLIANELVLNAIKYAYPDGRRGKIQVVFRILGPEFILEVRDEGRGFSPGFDPFTCPSMGLTLVRSLASQLRGGLSFEGPPGVAARLSFSVENRS